MYEVAQKISDKVLSFSPTEQGVLYVSNKIGEKDFKLVHFDGLKFYKDDLRESIVNPQIFGNKIAVAKTQGSYLYNNDLTNRQEINFQIGQSGEVSSLFYQYQGEVLTIGFIDNKSSDILWSLDANKLSSYFIGDNTFYFVKQLSKMNNQIYAYDLKTGKEKWLFDLEKENSSWSAVCIMEYDGKIFVHADHLYILDIKTGKLTDKQRTFGGVSHFEKGVPYISSYFNKVNLRTFKETTFDFNPLLIPYWDRFQKITYIDCIADGHLLVGTHQYLTKDETDEDCVFNLLVIDPNKNKVVWDHQFPNYGVENYKEARCEHGKLFFLDKTGCLTIFEKETQT